MFFKLTTNQMGFTPYNFRYDKELSTKHKIIILELVKEDILAMREKFICVAVISVMFHAKLTNYLNLRNAKSYIPELNPAEKPFWWSKDIGVFGPKRRAEFIDSILVELYKKNNYERAL